MPNKSVDTNKAIDLLNDSISEADSLPLIYKKDEDYHPWKVWLRTLCNRIEYIYGVDSKYLKEVKDEVSKIKQITDNLSNRKPIKDNLVAVLKAYLIEMKDFGFDIENEETEFSNFNNLKKGSTSQKEEFALRNYKENSAKSIVVIGALFEELSKLFDNRATVRFPLQLDWSRHILESLNLEYWSTQLDENYEIIAITPNSMGLIETATVATAAFISFKPVLSAMLGICGGRYSEGARLGHIVVPSQAFHYQFGAKTEDELRPEIRSESVDQRYFTAAQRISSHDNFEFWMNETHPKSMRPEARCQCHTGPMASSDYVAKWDKLIESAADMDRKVIGVDMESYAYLRSAKRCGILQKSFIVKCVTDYADKDKDDTVREWAQVAAARFFYFMLMRWIDDTNKTNYWTTMSREL